jgi:hypothetical protein
MKVRLRRLLFAIAATATVLALLGRPAVVWDSWTRGVFLDQGNGRQLGLYADPNGWQAICWLDYRNDKVRWVVSWPNEGRFCLMRYYNASTGKPL